MHNFQIREMQNFKDCHTQYLASAQQLDNKVQAVISVEKSNLTILKQLKHLNAMVMEMSNFQATSPVMLSSASRQMRILSVQKSASDASSARDDDAQNKSTQILSSSRA